MTPYAATAFAEELDKLRQTPEGQRNIELNRVLFRLTQLVAAGEADTADLAEAKVIAREIGLEPGEIEATYRSALRAGRRQPRVIEEMGGTVEEVTAEQLGGVPAERPSWAPVELAAILDGTEATPEPSMLTRADGVSLIYPGRVHSFHGESESGKSLILQIEAVRVLAAGGRVLFLDFESDPVSVVERLREFGATADQIRAGFTYVQPEARPDSRADELAAWVELLSRPYDLAVIDGVTDALGVWGLGASASNDNDAVTLWARALPKRIATKTGAAVVLVDHVTKDRESRGRYAVGGNAKLNALTGAAYTVDVVQPLGRGLRGVVRLSVAKDRPGRVRPHCGAFRPATRLQEAARVVVDSTQQPPVVTIEPPGALADGPATPAAGFRPTALMERLSQHLETAAEPQSQNAVVGAVGGKRSAVFQALTVLVSEGYVLASVGANNSRLHTSVRPYRQATDPASDRYQPAGNHLTGSAGGSGGGSRFPVKTGEPGNHLPGSSRNHLGTTREPLLDFDPDELTEAEILDSIEVDG